MARLKPNTKKIEGLTDVNFTLKEIGMLERQLEQIDADTDKEITKIKSEAVDKGDPIRKRIIKLSASISAYAEYNKEELFKEKKTIKLSFGCFGFRKSTKIRCKKTTVALLKKFRLKKCIRIKEEPDREAMKSLSDKTLAKVDANRKVNDEFFCEANKEEVNKALLEKQVKSA